MIGFVDDCNGQTTHNAFEIDKPTTEDPIQVLLERTTANAQKWSDLLQTSGGSLELSKCSCQVIDWQFTAHGEPYLKPKQPEHQETLQVTDAITGTRQALELLSPNQAHKTLGHYKLPAGTQKTQAQKLKQKSDDITAFLWRCPLTRLEAWTYYFACYLPSVGYPIPCSSMTKPQLDRIQCKAMQIIIPRCGFNRHTKREILFGPLELGGASFRHLYTQQGIGQVELFMRNWRANSTAGKLLRIAVHWCQIQVGVSFSFLKDVHTLLPHLESVWLTSLRGFLASVDSFLELDDPGIPSLERLHDAFIMDVLMESCQFTNTELRRLNYCRLYLHAYTLSDLVQANGSELDDSKLYGEPSVYSSGAIGPQIHQAKPSKSDWTLW